MATAREFFEWLCNSGCTVIRDGSYDLSFHNLWKAWESYQQTGNDALDELDLLTWLSWDSDAPFDGSEFTDEELDTTERIFKNGTIWRREIPLVLVHMVRVTLRGRRSRTSYGSRRKRASSHISKAEVRERIFSRDGYECQECGSDSNLSIDHIIPVRHGGDNSDDNLQTLCRSCNSKKGARL